MWIFECHSSMQCAPLKVETLTLWIFTRNEWGAAGHLRSCKKQSERPIAKSLRVLVSGLACAPGVSLLKLWEQFAIGTAACIWIFECNSSMQCAPLWNIMNIYKEWVGVRSCKKQSERPKSLRILVSGLAMRPKRFLVKFVGTVCNWYSMHRNVWV